MTSLKESKIFDLLTVVEYPISDSTSNASTIWHFVPGVQNSHHNSKIRPDEAYQLEYLTFETILPDFDEWISTVSHLGLKPPNLKAYDNPFEWSAVRKNICLALACAATYIVAYTSGSYSVTSASLEQQWHLSRVSFSIGLTTWAMGFAIGSMIMAPISEIIGRRPVFLYSGVIFLAALIGCAITTTAAGMMVARFFVGGGAAGLSIVAGGVVSDIYRSENRNAPMALYSASALTGQASGPLVCGFIVERAPWRWVFWHQVIGLAVTLVALYAFLKEPRGSVVLSRKVQVINSFYDDLQNLSRIDKTLEVPVVRYRVLADEGQANWSQKMYLSLTTPFKLLVTESVVFWFSLWASFAWGCFYMLYDVIPLIFTSTYSFTTEQAGAVFAAVVIGTLLAMLLSVYQEEIAKKYYPQYLKTPEGRLYAACVEAALLPIGFLWFGWTSRSSIHWIVPTIALAVVQMGIFSIYLAVFNYLADTYHELASSALACQSFCRNVFAAVFPLFTPFIFVDLGYGQACSLLAGVGAVLTVCAWLLAWKGKSIRARSRLASVLETR